MVRIYYCLSQWGGEPEFSTPLAPRSVDVMERIFLAALSPREFRRATEAGNFTWDDEDEDKVLNILVSLGNKLRDALVSLFGVHSKSLLDCRKKLSALKIKHFSLDYEFSSKIANFFFLE